jgi:hypothetical protein
MSSDVSLPLALDLAVGLARLVLNVLTSLSPLSSVLA